MAKYRKILVAYDGSPSARNAFIAAAQMAREDNCWIKVLAVTPTYEGDLDLIAVGDVKKNMEESAEKLLTEVQKLADSEDIHILINVEQGEPYDQIVQVAEDENCDLIVMGKHGRSGRERALMGCVTARVIGHTKKHVLVVPEQSGLAWDTVLLATDGSKSSDVAFDLALDIAKDRSAKLIAVSAFNPNRDNDHFALAASTVRELELKAQTILAEAKEKATKQGVTIQTIAKQGEAHHIITATASEHEATVVVMGTYGRKGISRLLMGSITERTIGYSPCPVIVAH